MGKAEIKKYLENMPSEFAGGGSISLELNLSKRRAREGGPRCIALKAQHPKRTLLEGQQSYKRLSLVPEKGKPDVDLEAVKTEAIKWASCDGQYDAIATGVFSNWGTLFPSS